MKLCIQFQRALILTVLFLSLANSVQAQPGTVKSHQKISDTQGGFSGTLDNDDLFGRSVTSLGDLDGDGVIDIAVGAEGDDDGGNGRGAVWIVFLNADGTVKSHQKISDTEGGFTGVLGPANEQFGNAVASLGDFDGDGVTDLAVGEWADKDGGDATGAVWLIFLNTDGTVKSHQKISATQGGFTGLLDNSARFGTSVAPLGDLDGDGVTDLAVGSMFQEAVWILFLNANGTVKSHQQISDGIGGFTGILDPGDAFGAGVATLGDLDGAGPSERTLAVGAWGDDDGSTGPCNSFGDCERGAVWLLFLNADGTVQSHQKISDTEGGFTGDLEDVDFFGVAVTSMGDFNSDGVTDLAVGAHHDDDGSPGPCLNKFLDCNRGAVWILLLNADGTVQSHQKISDAEGGFTGSLNDLDIFGISVTPIGDLDGDGAIDLAVGASGDNDGGTDKGAVWILLLNGFNEPPIADAGLDQTVIAGQTVPLDGSGSSDPDDDPLTYNWSFVLKPAGSTATFSDASAVSQTFVADVAGDYVIQLVVNDGTVDSIPDLVTITAKTPSEAIEDLIDEVEDIIEEGDLNNGQGNALISKLESAIKKINQDQPAVAINKLEAFINQVNAFIADGILTLEQGNPLIEAAEVIIDVLQDELSARVNSENVEPMQEHLAVVPDRFALERSYPNPFNPSTTIPFSLMEQALVKIEVYDLLGRRVSLLTEGFYETGQYEVNFNASRLFSGLYLVRAQFVTQDGIARVITQRVSLLK